MKPKKVTVEGEREERMKALCDEIVFRAMRMMTEDVRAPVEMVLDRVVTYAAAQICKIEGSARAAEVFRQVAAQIDGGLFHSVTGEGERH